MFVFLCKTRFFFFLLPSKDASTHSFRSFACHDQGGTSLEKTPRGPPRNFVCDFMRLHKSNVCRQSAHGRRHYYYYYYYYQTTPMSASNGFPDHCAPSPDICLVVVSSSVSPSWRDQSTVCVLYGRAPARV